jgi:hypothetical protein
MKRVVIRYRWPKSLDALLSAEVIAYQQQSSCHVQRLGTVTLLEHTHAEDDPSADVLYLLDYGSMLTVSYLAYCCERHGQVHVYDNMAQPREVPVRDNLSIHNVIGVATCAMVVRDFAFTPSPTQQSLFAYVEDALVLHKLELPWAQEFCRAVAELRDPQSISALTLEPAQLIERGKKALLADERFVQQLMSQTRTLAGCARLIEIPAASDHPALASIVSAILYHNAAPPFLLIALYMREARMGYPYILLRSLEQARSPIWEQLGLPADRRELECPEWEAIKARLFIA